MRGSKHKLASGDSVHLDALPPKLSTEESSDLSLQYRTASDLRDRAEEILYRSFHPYIHRSRPGPPLFEDRRERPRARSTSASSTHTPTTAPIRSRRLRTYPSTELGACGSRRARTRTAWPTSTLTRTATAS